MATQSFHETKNLTCGKGGALLINDLDLFERARMIRSKGTNRAQFLEGQVDKYTWVDLGSSYQPSNLLSAFLLCQLEERARIQQMRQAIWERYNGELAEWARAERVQLPVVPDYAEQTFHMFYLLLPTGSDRTRFISHMGRKGTNAVFHYVPLHSSPMGAQLGADPSECPVSENVSSRLVRLPFYTGMSDGDQSKVIRVATEFRTD